MPRRASSSASPLWIGIAVVGFAAVLGAGHFFQRGVADPFRTMTPLPVQDYLENSNSLRGNSYKLDGTIGSQIHAVDGVGRLYSVGLPGGEMLAVFVPPDFNQINIERGQRYVFKLEVNPKGLLLARDVKKEAL